MTDLTDMLKTELDVKSDKLEHHHDTTIVPRNEIIDNVTHELQSQLGQGKEIDRKIHVQHEKNVTYI